MFRPRLFDAESAGAALFMIQTPVHHHTVVVVAGHIDHGKTALVRALTGIDTDRLEEEKRRGMTIELGFASLDAGEGRVVSFIDVPGHERLVHTMIAGASGVDGFLLVIDAAEGVMPQTREHLEICRAFGVTRGIAVVNKIDRVDEEWAEFAAETVREWLKSEGYPGIPVFCVSAVTGAGLEELRNALAALTKDREDAAEDRSPRLAVDRVFPVAGAGTVVTGTLRDGTLAAGTPLVILPGGVNTRVRRMQVHGRETDRVPPGCRVALNVSGVHHQDISRGDWAAAPGSMIQGRTWLAWVDFRRGAAPPPDRPRFRVHFHHGTRALTVILHPLPECRARGLVLIQSPLELPGRMGDRFILRKLNPVRFLGSGELITPVETGLKRFRRRRLDRPWRSWAEMSPDERWLTWIRSGPRPWRTETEALAWSGRTPEAVRSLGERFRARGCIFILEMEGRRCWISADTAEALYRAARECLEQEPGESVPLGRWVRRWLPSHPQFGERLAAMWMQENRVRIDRGRVMRITSPGRSGERGETVLPSLLRELEVAGFAGLPLAKAKEKARRLGAAGDAWVDIARKSHGCEVLNADGKPYLIGPEAVAGFRRFLAEVPPGGRITLQDLKQRLKVPRRIVMGYLALGRDRGWLMRSGSEHRVRPFPEHASN